MDNELKKAIGVALLKTDESGRAVLKRMAWLERMSVRALIEDAVNGRLRELGVAEDILPHWYR